MRTLDTLFSALAQSTFRNSFVLKGKDLVYLQDKGLEEVMLHAQDFIQKRIAPAQPVNDGKQTPMRGHPVFVAQHATAVCCRGCVQQWHGLPQGRALSADEQAYLASVLRYWLHMQLEKHGHTSPNPVSPRQSRLW